MIMQINLGVFGGGSQDGKYRVVIGKDTRQSSYISAYALVVGLPASVVDVYLMYVTTDTEYILCGSCG